MPLVIDNDALSATANSYVSVAEMLEYVTTRHSESVAETWSDLESQQQIALLVNATRSVDSFTTWIGQKYSRDQGLAWPRYDAWYDGYMLDVTTVPVRIKEAVFEMALWSMQNGGAVFTGQNREYDSIKVGPLSIDFNEGAGGTAKQYFPDIVAYLLRGLGEVSNPLLPSSNQIRVVRLIRA